MTAPGTVSNKESTFKASRLDLKKITEIQKMLLFRAKRTGVRYSKREHAWNFRRFWFFVDSALYLGHILCKVQCIKNRE